MKIYKLITLASFGLLSILVTPTHAANDALDGPHWQAQRQQFQQAYQALLREDWAEAEAISAQLTEYPLYYYLRYRYFKPDVQAVPTGELVQFFAQFRDAPLVEMLRRGWLLQLGQQQQWADYLRLYTPHSDKRLECLAIRAHLGVGEPLADWLDTIANVWLVGKSLPGECDPLFELLYTSPRMTDDLVWQRLRYSLNANNSKLAAFLRNKLVSTQAQARADAWLKLHNEPQQALASLDLADGEFTREIIRHGVQRLAAKEPAEAWVWWQVHQGDYAFSAHEKGTMARAIALAGAAANVAEARVWLTELPETEVNADVLLARVKLALLAQDWAEMLAVLPQLPPEIQVENQWQYWRARALAQTGDPELAREFFAQAARARDFYGFLAADYLALPHELQEKNFMASEQEPLELYQRYPGVLRAREFYYLAFAPEARAEWETALKAMNRRERAVAAWLASQWGWHDRAISAAADSEAMDDLRIRFPLAFQEEIQIASTESGVAPEYTFATIRQESAFMTFVHSSAGAMGLMQLMPGTAQQVARQLGLAIQSTDDVKSVATNLRLGTAYLRGMLDKFDNHPVAASAAYNAGPGRALRWLRERGCLPADIWIETIPFPETRLYVKRVMEYKAVYRVLLGLPPQPLRLEPLPAGYCQAPAP